MHIEQKLPTEMIHELSPEKQEIFHKIVKIDVAAFKEKYFSGDKQPLFIIGTSKYGRFKNVNHFILNLEEDYNKYKDKYQIVYKPHPRYPPKNDKPLNDFFAKHNIKVIEDALPFEVIMSSFENCVMGGFDSTVYLSAEPHQVLFFFAPGPQGLYKIFTSLYNQGFYPVAEFIDVPDRSVSDDSEYHQNGGNDTQSLQGGEIAGIVIGVVAFITIIACVVIFLIVRSRKKSQEVVVQDPWN